MTPIIEAINITKVYDLRPVLRGVNLSLDQGERVILFGPNGAGKTTLLRIIATLIQPTMGELRLAGYPAKDYALTARGLIGVVMHSPLLYGDLTALENLRFYSRMYNLDRATREERMAEVLAAVGLKRRADDLVETFSRGMKQRLAIARAILHDPPIMLLDEPYTGLDQDAAATLDRVLTDVALEGRSILMITHNIPRGLAHADRLVILSKGRIVHDAAAKGMTPLAFSELYAEKTDMVSTR
ncbi:MAG: heme ABC exporter ATP-binding protein CcmA [Chloroflexi bacterium]|nr:heme ABC exporter ATP-binding protein CcmA [Chloroflexota bacterium]